MANDNTTINGITYTPISKLEEFTGNIQLTDLILISQHASKDVQNEYVSRNSSVSGFINTLSAAIEPTLFAAFSKNLKKLAFMDPCELNNHPEITAYVERSLSAINAPYMTAISSIHWTNGIIDEIGTVALSNMQAKVTDINSKGTPIAKIDGQQIYNGLDVKQITKSGFEIAQINGTSIYSGQQQLNIECSTSRGQNIANVKMDSAAGTTNYAIKNGVDIVPTVLQGESNQVGQEIFKYNDVPIYNNVKVTSLVSSQNPINSPIAEINGTKIYNGVNIKSTNVGQTIATINGTEIKNGVDIDPSGFRNDIQINESSKGNIIATIDGKPLRNGVNVDNYFNSKTGTKIANIAGTDVYSPGSDLTALTNIGTRIADVKTGNGSVVGLFSGVHPYVHLTQSEYEQLKINGKLDANTYYFTEGLDGNTSYRESAIYRYQSTPDANGQYKWFELWPDGWCKQGGTQKQASTNVNTVLLQVPYTTTNYNIQVTRKNPTQCDKPQNSSNVVSNTIKVDQFQFISVCSNQHNTVCWVTEGIYDTNKVSEILSKYSNFKKTDITVLEATTNMNVTGGNLAVGQIIAYAGNDIPAGWLLCDGTAVSKDTYSALYAVIGDNFGTCADKNKFLLPQLTDARYLQGYTAAGKPYEAGLPNITGEGGLGWISNFGNDGKGQVNGAFAFKSNTGYGVNDNSTSPNDRRIDFSANRSNPIYGASETVRPKSLTVRYLICWKATTAGDGGGVIDGTICQKPDKSSAITSLEITSTGIYQTLYTACNDCYLVICAQSAKFTYGITYYIKDKQENRRLIASYYQSQDPPSEDQGQHTFGVPVKKGTIIEFMRNSGLSTKFSIYEYQFKSLNPQIAMPDWDSTQRKEILCARAGETKAGTYSIVENGYIVIRYGGTMFKSGSESVSVKINNNIVLQNYNYSSADSPDSSVCFPVSVGDIVDWTSLKLGTESLFEIMFYPCKPIQQKDCASYCVESWREGKNWCRVYSDGWCEQGGCNAQFDVKTDFLTSFVDVNYIVNVTNRHHKDYWVWCEKTDKTGFKAHLGNDEKGKEENAFDWKAEGWIR